MIKHGSSKYPSDQLWRTDSVRRLSPYSGKAGFLTEMGLHEATIGSSRCDEGRGYLQG